MTYRSGRSKKNSRYINIALGIVAFSLFVFFWPTFRSTVYPLVEPLVRGYGGTKGVVSLMPETVRVYFSSRDTLAEKNKQLEMEIERLENDVAERDAFIREQAFLTSTSTIGNPTSAILLYPIAEDVTKLYSTIVLSKGYKDGVEKGGLVYVRGLQPVCEIVEVYDKTSLCELLSKGNRITEGVTGSSSITLLLTGEGGGSFTAEVPKGTQVFVGEPVYLRSDQAFVLGTIVSMQEDEQSTGAYIYVRGAYNPVTSSVFYLNTSYAP